MKQIKVLLATSGPISASRLTRDIAAHSDMVLVGHAPDLSQAYILAELTEPDVVLIGLEMIRQSEFEGLLSLLSILGSAWLEIETDRSKVASLRPGVPEPHAGQPSVRPGLPSDEFRDKLRSARPLRSRIARPSGPSTPAIAASITSPQRDTHASGSFAENRMILIGASTGGIDALLTILSAFPANCPPTAIVQHTGAAFSDSLIRLFTRCCAAKVVAAQTGIAMQPGTVVVGAGCAGHLRLTGKRAFTTEVTQGAPISGHVPSVDALFRSAVPFAPNVVAALLTGMGRDGAQGLLELKRAGATTFAQDEATSVVWGMPRAAVELGGAGACLPLGEIASTLLTQCQAGPARAAAR